MRDLNYFYTSFGEWFRNVRPVFQAQMKPLSAEELAANPVNAPDALRENLAIGSAAQVIERIKRYEDMGYDEYAYWMDSGIDPAIKRDALCRFIDKVIPASENALNRVITIHSKTISDHKTSTAAGPKIAGVSMLSPL